MIPCKIAELNMPIRSTEIHFGFERPALVVLDHHVTCAATLRSIIQQWQGGRLAPDMRGETPHTHTHAHTHTHTHMHIRVGGCHWS